MVKAISIVSKTLADLAGRSVVIDSDVVAFIKDKLRRAVLTLVAVPDPDKRFLRLIGQRWNVVREAAEAYGWTQETTHFRPNPRDVQVYLEVLSWLTWFEREHEAKVVQLFIAWAMGASWLRLSRQFDKSERTLRYWIDDMVKDIAGHFHGDVEKIFLDELPGMRKLSDSTVSDAVVAPEPPTTIQQTTQAWIADGIKPSADETIPSVSDARAKLVDKLERGNRRRKRRRSDPRQ
jgi:Domain of unknown function (DUF6362)